MSPKTIRTGTAGKMSLRLVQTNEGFVGLISEKSKILYQSETSDPDKAWSDVHTYLAGLGPNWFGFDGAKNRFLHWFAGGFNSPNYLAGERAYKLDVKERLEKACPLEAALDSGGHGEAVLASYRGTNLLHPIEKTKLQDLLRGPQADAFIRAAAQFTLGERNQLARMAALAAKYDSAAWTVVTYLPFLWRPDEHLFLKPEVTKDFASRVGHSFVEAYEPDINVSVYEELLDLGLQIRTHFADLQPRDNVDVQSVIWVTEAYVDGRDEPQP